MLLQKRNWGFIFIYTVYDLFCSIRTFKQCARNVQYSLWNNKARKKCAICWFKWM